MASPFNQEMLDELMSRKVAEWRADEKRKAIVQTPNRDETSKAGSALDPKLAMLLGQATDWASTYSFLKRGTRHEDNSTLQGLNKNPEKVIPTAIANVVGSALLHKLLSKKHPKIADTLGGLLGGYHMALGGNNFEPVNGRGSFSNANDDLNLGR